MSDAIVCEALTKVYGSRTVVNGLTLRVPENTIFGFLGPNGAGKSTGIRLLTGQIKPTRGKAWVAGVDITTRSIQSRFEIGYLPELPNFYSWMRGRELLEFAGQIFGMNAPQRRARAKELLRLTGIEEAGERKLGTYSGGMRQRLGIAQALVNHPRVIFLDEPVSALDPLGRRDVLSLLNTIKGEATVFMSSHVLADVDRVCERIAILNRGNLVVAGSTTEIKAQYAVPGVELIVAGGLEAAGKLTAALKGLPGMEKAERGEAGRVSLALPDEDALLQAGRVIPGLISSLGLTLLEFRANVPDLEDVFVKLLALEKEASKQL